MDDRSRRGERGAVTAETAMAMPILAALTVGLVWVLAVAGAQLRTVDAAREGARALARGESEATAHELAAAVAPEGAKVRLSRGDGRVTVTVSAQLAGPGGVFRTSGTQVSSTAVAALEPEVGQP